MEYFQLNKTCQSISEACYGADFFVKSSMLESVEIALEPHF